MMTKTTSKNKIINPILTGFHPDPSICRRDNDYYIATSTFEWFPGVRIFHSSDLSHWSLVSTPLDRVSQLDMKGNPDSGGIWAPCLTFADNLFWLVYTNVKAVDSPWKNGRNYLVTAENIEGPWSEPISMGNGGFDPSLFHHHDGKKYLTYRPWGPRHHSNPYNNIVLQEYFHKEQRLDPKRSIIFTGTDRKLTEAPHIYHVGEYYYLITAEGGTLFEHTVTVARAKDLFGPYELHPDETIICTLADPKNPIQKSGHACFVEGPLNQWYMVYLVGRPLKLLDADQSANKSASKGYCPLGRETAIDKIEWKNGWPYAINGSYAKPWIEVSHSVQDNNAHNDVFTDNFDTEVLNRQWQTLRIPFNEEIGCVNSEQATLRLFGKDSLVSQFVQATVAKRWQHFSFDAITSFCFKPKNEQQSAGLTCYYNTKNWTFCFVDFDEEHQQRSIKLIQVDQNKARYFLYDSPILVPDTIDIIWLSVSVRELSYQYHYSFDGVTWQCIDITFESWKLSDDYVAGKGFFTGAFVGLHCADISGDGCYADFDLFKYIPTEVTLPCPIRVLSNYDENY